MTPAPISLSQIAASERGFGIATNVSGRRLENPFFDGPHDVTSLHDDGVVGYEFRIAKEKADQFDAQKRIAEDELLGDWGDHPGALSTYHKHRIIEAELADYLYHGIEPHCQKIGRPDLAFRQRKTAFKLLSCRRDGPFGINSRGKLVVAWKEKCGCSKLCPDESRHESQRVGERYIDAIREHEKQGGRVYKCWLTLPNYPGGRLLEGKRHIFKRARAKLIRATKKGKNKFGIVGALIIQEDPLSRDRDWNVHLNCIILTTGWLSFENLRAVWGFNLKVKQHSQFDDKGMAGLFNEMVKYSLRSVPEKSADKRHDIAPALTEWTPTEFLEWDQANIGFRRTRAYGSLHGIGKPDHEPSMPKLWLGSIKYQPSGYVLSWRHHNLAQIARESLAELEAGTLNLIRGDKSTTRAPP